ncbi:MAG: response regulator [Acidobacteria bacterium]|jgi:CheY-like chemotaxis protein|nr:response regulator [Acidobacteriota bacterium]
MSQGNRSVVLLVEDDPDHAELVSRALAEDGERVSLVHFANGDSALQYLERVGAWADPDASPRPDLILLDLRLPGLGGGEVLSRIRSVPSLCEIPVVILSTSRTREELAVAAGGGADACAVKPMDGEGFRELVRELVWSWTTVESPGT